MSRYDKNKLENSLKGRKKPEGEIPNQDFDTSETVLSHTLTAAVALEESDLDLDPDTLGDAFALHDDDDEENYGVHENYEGIQSPFEGINDKTMLVKDLDIIDESKEDKRIIYSSIPKAESRRAKEQTQIVSRQQALQIAPFDEETTSETSFLSASLPEPIKTTALPNGIEETTAQIRNRGGIDSATVVMPLGELLKKAEFGQAAAGRTHEGRFIHTFLSAKGGSGSTFLATSMAAELSSRGKKVCVIDLNLQFGDALEIVGARRKVSIAGSQKLVSEGKRLNEDMFAEAPGGYRIISQVGSFDDLDQVSALQIPELVAELKTIFEYIIFDGPQDFSESALGAIDCTEKISLVVNQNILSLRRAQKMIEILERIGFDCVRDLIIIINKYATENEVPKELIKREVFPKQELISVGRFDAMANRALELQMPFSLIEVSHPFSNSLKRMTQSLLGEELDEEMSSGGYGLLSTLMFWKNK